MATATHQLRAAPKRAGPGPGAFARSRAALPFGAALQPRLALGPIRDPFEREADRAAAHVTGGRAGWPALTPLPGLGAAPPAQRACAACGRREEEKGGIQRKCACGAAPGEPCACGHDHAREPEEDKHPEMRPQLRAKPGAEARAEDSLAAVASVVRRPGRPLPDGLRQDMERGFGRPLGQVRLHDDSRAAASAEAIGAHAYTVGSHITFNRGQYRPETAAGRFLIAHELAHTLQQGGAPRPGAAPLSHAGGRHEAEADRAAGAALTGAPMPALTPGAPAVSRLDGDDALEAATVLLAPGAALIAAGAGLLDDALGLTSDLVAFVQELAAAVGGAVSLDGTTIVIDIPDFDPCPELEFQLALSDIGLDPDLYFPIAAGAFTVGPVTAYGVLGVEANLDPGFGLRLEDCSFGPAQIRINPLLGGASVSGMVSITTSSMVSLGADLGLRADLGAIIAIPFDPPIVLVVPVLGVSFGGMMQLMLQSRGTLSNAFTASVGLGGVSAASLLSADVGYGLDLAYGLYGGFSILGLDLCRVAWPLDRLHEQIAARLTLATSLSLDRSGLAFSFAASARPLAANPLADLSFAFDESRMEDDCWLCEFMTENGLMPGQNGYDWAALLPRLPSFGGPLSNVYARDPGLKSGATCRGACGVDCPDGNCTAPYDKVLCENRGDRHVWHTYKNYATCGAHQGCKDHDACYDFAAEMPVWGFGGFMVGPMYRACDLEAICGYGFQQAVGWAGGGGPYSPPRLRFADKHVVTPGCLGPCPRNVAAEGEPEKLQTCLEDRELWTGLQIGDSWTAELLNQRLFQGFVKVPYIIGVHYGVDAHAQVDADASAELGLLNLQNACLIYDPATMTYTGTAELALHLNGRASASVTAALDGFLSDFLCLFNWVTLRGSMNAGVTVQLPTDLIAGVDLYCARGDLEVRPRVGIRPCLDLHGRISAGLDVFILSINVWRQEWPLVEKTLQKCWEIELAFEPFRVGEMPDFALISNTLPLDDLLGALFEPAAKRDIDRTPARSPLPSPAKLLFPCLSEDGDDEEDEEDTRDCPRKAKVEDARNLLSPSERTPVWGSTRSVSIPGGSSAAVATVMTAEFLDKDLTGGSPPGSSTQAGIYGWRGLPTEGCFKAKKKDSQRFIKGHLLNENTGGTGKDEKNLFPITGKANGDHKRRVEQGGVNVVKQVRDGFLLYYKVTVQEPSPPREITNSAGAGMGFYEIGSSFLCEIADYQYCTDDTLRRNALRQVTIPSQFDFHPSDGRPFDQLVDPNLCRR